MFERWMADGRFLGYRLRRGSCFFFFGSRFVNRDDLAKLFPHYEFCFLRQVHGVRVVAADPMQVLEADGHFTSTPGRALVIQTADCVPLLFSSRNAVAAVHAGWRGAAGGIAHAIPFASEFAAIGPHIGAASFEVGEDVAAQLGGGFSMPSGAPGKVLYNLEALLRTQVTGAVGVGQDTLRSSEFHSFRRDGAAAGRQFSFVLRE